MSYPYRVVKRWKTKTKLRSYRTTGDHWWDRNAEFEKTDYKISEYERREYFSPDTGKTYTQDVEVDSWTETKTTRWYSDGWPS